MCVNNPSQNLQVPPQGQPAAAPPPPPEDNSRVVMDRQGFPIDLNRPIVKDKEGVHTEVSVTERFGDKYVNLPTIWNGKRYDPRSDKDWEEIRQHAQDARDKGWKFPEFKNMKEAIKAAKDRSKYINEVRGDDLRKAEGSK